MRSNLSKSKGTPFRISQDVLESRVQAVDSGFQFILVPYPLSAKLPDFTSGFPNYNNNNNNNKYKVNQYNIIKDVLGGCSKEVEKNIKELVGDKCESIMRQMQKEILSSSLHIARMFKLSA